MKKKYVLKKVSTKPMKTESVTVKSQSTSLPSAGSVSSGEPWNSSSGSVSGAPKSVPSLDEALKKVAESENKPAPKKRGRPPKSGSIAPSAQGSATSTNPSTGPSPSLGATAGAIPNSVSPPIQKVEIPDFVIKPFLKIPFAVAAARTGYRGWALDKDEEEALIPQWKDVMAQYLPAINSPHAALAMACISTAVIVGAKYMAMQDWKEEERLKERSRSNGMRPAEVSQ